MKEVINRAEAISKSKRKDIIMSIKEIELHKYLKELFESMEKNIQLKLLMAQMNLAKTW